MKKIFIIIAIAALALTGCEKLQQSADTDDIISLTNHLIVDDTGYYSMNYLAGFSVFNYVNVETATEEIVEIAGEPQIFYRNNGQSANLMKIYPINNAEQFLFNYNKTNDNWIEIIDAQSGEKTTLYEGENIALWPVGYDSDNIYLSVLDYEKKEQRLISVNSKNKAELTTIATLSTEIGVLGQDATSFTIQVVDNRFYCTIFTENGNLLSKIEQDGTANEIATIPNDGSVVYSGFCNGAYYWLSQDLMLAKIDLATGETTELGKLQGDYPPSYLQYKGGSLFTSRYFNEGEGRYLLVDFDSLSITTITMEYDNEYPTMPAEKYFVTPFAVVGDKLVVNHDSEAVSVLTYSEETNMEEFVVLMHEKLAIIEKEDYINNNPVYSSIDQSETLSLVNRME